jgi:hypothetical protein
MSQLLETIDGLIRSLSEAGKISGVRWWSKPLEFRQLEACHPDGRRHRVPSRFNAESANRYRRNDGTEPIYSEKFKLLLFAERHWANSARSMQSKIGMGVKIAYFSSLMFAGLAMAPAFAHLLELLNKIGLPRDEYFVVQQIYRGWALLGVVIFSALLSMLILTIMLRRRRKPFILVLIAFLAIVGTQAIFWTYTQPANLATDNWTTIPQNWEILRRQWEYSHAASAGLNFLAFVALVLSLLGRGSSTN